MAKHTPLYETHKKLGARLVDFAGWELPIQYAGVIEEHRAVRTAAGVFDVSHMGEIEIAGPDAASCVQHLTTNDVGAMSDGRAQYSLLLNERATVIDDVIIYRFSPEQFLFVVNASNAAKDFAWMRSRARGNVTVTDRSLEFALIAFQGPRASEVLQQLTHIDLASIKTYYFAQGAVAGIDPVVVARTGYTGEDGFELFVAPQSATALWQAIFDAGASHGVQPAGLGARDTLRMEMKYSLYGHEITEETNPYEAGLGWVVKLDRPHEFIGKTALAEIKARGLTRTLVGFIMNERAIPRQGYAIVSNDAAVGTVTSGTHSPSLDVPIGIGFVPPALAAIGTHIGIDIRGRVRQAEIVATPFYRSSSQRSAVSHQQKKNTTTDN